MNISQEAREAASVIGANGISDDHFISGQADWHPLVEFMQGVIDQTMERCSSAAHYVQAIADWERVMGPLPRINPREYDLFISMILSASPSCRALKSNPTDGGEDER